MSFLVAQWVKDLALSLLWLGSLLWWGFSTWPGNICMPQACPPHQKKKLKRKNNWEHRGVWGGERHKSWGGTLTWDATLSEIRPSDKPPIWFFSRLSSTKKKILCNRDKHITHIYMYTNMYEDIIYKWTIILFCAIKDNLEIWLGSTKGMSRH